jgi:hypothetical protein
MEVFIFITLLLCVYFVGVALGYLWGRESEHERQRVKQIDYGQLHAAAARERN